MGGTPGPLNLVLAHAVKDIRITVNDSSAQEEDLNLLPCGSTADGRPAASSSRRTRPRPCRAAGSRPTPASSTSASATTSRPTASAAVFVADEDPTRVATIRAGTWIDIFGDFGNADGGWGTTMHLHGELWSGWNGTANFGGTLLTLCNLTDNPDAHACNFTRVFGNNDVDTINFDETYLRNKTRAYGSSTPTPYL